MISELTTTTRDGWTVLLTPFRPDDAERVCEICQDPEIPRWTSVPSVYTLATAEEFVNVRAAEAWRQVADGTFRLLDEGPELVWAVRLTDGPMPGLCGCVGLKRPGSSNEIGWWLAAEARGHGVIRAAVERVLRTAREELGAADIWWNALVGNVASARIAQRTGFRFTGEVAQLANGSGPAWTAVLHPDDPLTPRDDWPVLTDVVS